MNYTFTTQSEVPALFISIKSIVFCLLWNAEAIHLILDDSEVSSGQHQHTHPVSLSCQTVIFSVDKSLKYSGCN